MKTCTWWWKSIGRVLTVLLALALAAGPWFARQAHAGSAHRQVPLSSVQATPAPTAPSGPQAAGESRSNTWMLMLLMIVCSMGLLLLVGVGAAILMVRIRERL
jgi:hypothetical protein